MTENVPTDLYLDKDKDDISHKKVKLVTQETIAKRMQFNPWKKSGTGLNILTPKPRLPILLAQIKSGNNSN